MVAKKTKIIVFSSISILAIVLVFGYYLTTSSTMPAQLHIESGNIFVNNQLIAENIKLSEGDIIETKENSFATVLLYESIIINLEPLTSISIDELTKKHPKVSQQFGSTWNTFTKLSGVEAYTNTAGNSVASVRATSFGLKNEYIIGGEGEVNFKIGEETFVVKMNKIIEKVDGIILERDATPEEKREMIQKMERAIKELRYLREKEIEKSPIIMKIVKKRTGLSDEELRTYLRNIDESNENIDDLIIQSPIKIELIYKIAETTKSIQKIKRSIREVNG